jgi:nucleoside-diphosphate-sugar epimerase
MTTTIAVAGSNGNLGKRICAALIERGAEVRAIVRAHPDAHAMTEKFEHGAADIVRVSAWTTAELQKACAGAACVVSALQGLRDVIVDAQTVLLDGAVAAGVPRFIPSDYSIDFMKVPAGQNRNLDLRREFHAVLAKAAIAGTSVLNGAFAELLISRMPLLDFTHKRVTYAGDADQKLDFTTMDNTAAFTAAAALDPAAPDTLRIAGDQLSARELAQVAGEVTHSTFELVRTGSVDELAALIDKLRAETPGETDPYPRWQGMQYMHNMFSGLAKLEPVDNARYPGIHWTTVRELIERR